VVVVRDCLRVVGVDDLLMLTVPLPTKLNMSSRISVGMLPRERWLLVSCRERTGRLCSGSVASMVCVLRSDSSMATCSGKRLNRL